MKKILVLVIFFNFLFSGQDDLKNKSLIELFNQKYYTYICDKRWKFINEYNNKREDLLSLVAYSCLKKRYITPALDLAKVLKVTKEGRKNATYIVTLFLMKKLIMQLLNDDLNMGDIKLPTINDNELGRLFKYIQDGDYEKEGNSIIINLHNKKYKIWMTKRNNIVIDTLINGQLEKREYYW
ncbi:hypothetical protein NAMH_1149 [Nautilia profundicola AmH]|uniref:Uncharacterized protein n=1 Tax=Nautilia profundicola (strain ATCC BAA-1463 / DSM 18972 / AmH) TaxID=598659 RepID=B9LA87_NAUPA|nr:hypothetical protein [Nautilia profundicola]ACM93122.1 hypothetical protein NAMH_1149 [Nautilia profundicola AmH]